MSAPGKLLLFGEHAVIYGHPCIVTAVAQRMHATVTLTKDGIFTLDAPDVNIHSYTKPMDQLGSGDIPRDATFAEHAVRLFAENNPTLKGVHIKTASEFTSTVGFGSSSASTVCIVGALHQLLNGKIDRHAIFKLAYETVLKVQGTGSGADLAAAVFGGTILFARGGEVLEPLTLKELPLVIGYSGKKADTVSIIQKVQKMRDENTEKIDDVFAQIGRITELAKTAVTAGDMSTAGTLMDLNQELLSSLGISTAKLDSMITAARAAGAFGAKISGAGGGDCMIALADDDHRSAVMQAMKEAGGQVVDIAANAEGLRLESPL
jgi:mevalonate kinase